MSRRSSPAKSSAKFMVSLALACGFALPAYATVNAPVPEPDMLALLSLAVAGVLLGRRLATKPPPDE